MTLDKKKESHYTHKTHVTRLVGNIKIFQNTLYLNIKWSHPSFVNAQLCSMSEVKSKSQTQKTFINNCLKDICQHTNIIIEC